MILVALGANLPGPAGPPRDTLAAALARLPAMGVTVARRSPWYRSAPVPPSDQPWFVNGVAEVRFDGPPEALMDRLHMVEADFGRRRDGTLNAARALDLDLLDVDGMTRAAGPVLPHPRLHQRAFVLLPLADVAPAWRHPILGQSVTALIAALGPLDGIMRDPDDTGGAVAPPPIPPSPAP
ncbi:2-amino-4-hydroxy-6-hydroxymethyldihydropteridine diphosphokinase [Roseospira visakhapatnamensis]|uniref:2-amino-4-hydroxy-6-hydroxymethyldihydropteridine pyrophosphokinase n=1 Tax=Roseospira visakhapatnamensis TaxID=390880 RepID=A0A7W6RFL0_9PROT|nr:2-amino-4-hydroxy-6-hydroxymethyldihydropteridine diphosphokinase [Roseospira visakhapatnamensis]MBB4267671.1 2-amino-4-hydroxy-6-hydroxymethyldihydropteridine diphosphokinase [Roseospira visakhapatnamensis]